MGLHEILPLGAGQNRTKLWKDIWRIPHRLRHRFWRYRHRHIYSQKAGWPSLSQGKKIVCILGIHESNGHEWRLGREEGAAEKWQIQLPSRLHKPSQLPGKERPEILSNQFHSGHFLGSWRCRINLSVLLLTISVGRLWSVQSVLEFNAIKKNLRIMSDIERVFWTVLFRMASRVFLFFTLNDSGLVRNCT